MFIVLAESAVDYGELKVIRPSAVNRGDTPHHRLRAAYDEPIISDTTHFGPTGMQVKVQTERSLTQNKRVALGIIQARLQEIEEAKQHASVAADRKSQVGTGDRSEKIRTYNYPQGRVTDHRIGFTSYNLQSVMEGNLDPFIDALTIADESAKLAAAGALES